MVQARVEKKKKDPVAINFLGEQYWHGHLGLQKDVRKAIKIFTEAAELGSIEAAYNLGIAYDNGLVVEKDKTKSFHYYKIAAMQGHAMSRHNLGSFEGERGNRDRAVRHLLISAKMGDKDSVEMIKRLFMAGAATKEQFVGALKGYTDAVEGTKSHDRDEARRL